MNQSPALKRNIGPWLLVFFGLGNILGAGIYVLIGKVASEAGYFAPLAFTIAALVAALSALSYAELSGRFPAAGGEVVYIQKAYKNSILSMLTGLLIAAAGLLSSSTILRGFAGYMQLFWPVSDSLIILLAVVAIGGIAIWGVKQSLRVAALFTIVEIIGLLLIMVPGMDWQTITLARLPEINIVTDPGVLAGVVTGAFLAFFAFIGFEDMVNLAEEVKDPSRTMPIAIIAALIISTGLYILISLVAVSHVSPAELGASDAPLSLVFTKITGQSPYVITLISLFAISNGALVQVVMISRLLFGMGSQFPLFSVFFQTGKLTGTPVRATLLAVVLILILALWFPLHRLAELTSTVILIVFIAVNASLIKVRRDEARYPGLLSRIQPWLGIVLTLFLLVAYFSV